MEKTATLNLRVNPEVKQKAENVLSRLGVSMSTAIDIYLNQISLTGGIPFAVTLPKQSVFPNADLMTADEIRRELEIGIESAQAGKVRNASEAFKEFIESHENAEI